MAFSATDAAFEGFRLARRQPLAILIWAAATFVFSMASAAIMIQMAGPAIAEMMALEQSAQSAADPARTLALLAAAAPAYGLMMALALGYYAVLIPAVERAVLAPLDKGLAFLRFGRVELRHRGMVVVLSLIVFALYLVVVLGVSAVFAALLAAGTGMAAGLVALVAGLAGLVLILCVLARFSLAGPAALMEGGLGLGRSWALTKGRVWPVLGGLIITVLLAIVVALLIFAIFGGVAAATVGLTELGALFSPDMSSLEAYFTPLVVVYGVVGAVSSALTFAIVVGYGASVYQQLAGQPEAG